MLNYVKNFGILCRCLLYALRRRGALGNISAPKSACVVQTAQMGDMICTTPMFRAIKKKYPNIKLYVVGTEINREILRGNQDIDEYLVWRGGVRIMAEKINAFRCDFACVAGPGFPTLAALYLAGVPLIVAPIIKGGSSPTETLSYRLLRLLVTTVPHYFESYAPREYLRLLEPLGIHGSDTQKYVYFSSEAKNSLADKLGSFSNKPFAVVSPSSGNKIKHWPPERFAQVAEHIAKNYMSVVVIGAATDKEEVAQMMTHISSQKILNISERLSVEELKALIAEASLFISVDTGPLYIAEALGVPTIDIVGPVSESVQPPRGPRNITLVPPRKRAELFIMNAREYDEVEARRQAEATTAEEVIGAVDKLISL